MRYLIFASLFFTTAATAADASLVVNIIECESGGKYNAVGDAGRSVGIAQFQKDTFKRFKFKARMPHLQWKRPIDQLRLMVWMLDHGYGNEWTCYRELINGGWNAKTN